MRILQACSQFGNFCHVLFHAIFAYIFFYCLRCEVVDLSWDDEKGNCCFAGNSTTKELGSCLILLV